MKEEALDALAPGPPTGGGFRPTAVQELLLRAAIRRGPEAVEAWREWKSKADIERLDPGSFRILPLLSGNLHALEVSDPLAERLRGIHRITWFTNQVMFRGAAALVNALHQAGVRTMVLKGAPLAILHYRDIGLRPMGDIDILVPAGQATEAVDRLFAAGWEPTLTPLEGFRSLGAISRLGWTPKPRRRDEFTGAYFAVRHAHGFRNTAGQEIDLHWRIYQKNGGSGAEDDIWQRAVPVGLHGVNTLAPCPTDQLVHVCAHGIAWNAVPPIRWVADAAAVMRGASPGIDWELLVKQARRRGLTLPLGEALDYLRKLLDAPVPAEVIESLRRERVTLMGRIEHRAGTSPPGLVKGFLEVRYLAQRYRELARRPGADGRIPGFFPFLRQILGMDHLWQLPMYATFEGLRRMRGMLLKIPGGFRDTTPPP